jgi:type VI secretion system protein VasG
MLLAEPRALIDKLSNICRRAVERGAGACVTRRQYEVTVEHVFLALLEDGESEASALLAHYRVDTGAVTTALNRVLDDQRTGAPGRPVLNRLLLEWLQDGWLYASMDLGDTLVRSGALLARLLAAPSSYMPGPLAALDAVPRDDLRQNLAALTRGSAEAPAAGATTGPAQGRASEGEGALARFTTNLTERARGDELDPVFGREAEVRQVVDILCRRRKNNPILVGEPGVGKTALAEGLALRIVHGEVPDMLKEVQLVVLDLGALQAGAGVRGEFEKRLNGVIAEVKASPKPIVLFIDEAHTLIGSGGPQGGGDAANLLKPALARGEMRVIAATTWAEYKRYFEKDAALERRFQVIKVEEPSIDNAVGMLRGLAGRFEKAHGVRIRDEAVHAAVVLSSRYISGRQLPDKAVDLLDTAAARVKVQRASPPAELEDTRARERAVDRAILALDADERSGVSIDATHRGGLVEERAALALQASAIEKELLRQRGLVQAIDDARKEDASAEAKDGLRSSLESFTRIPADKVLLHPDVDEGVIASVIADWTGIPVGRMVKDDVAAVLNLVPRLAERVRGQDAALDVLGRELRAARSGLKPAGPPLGVFLLVGPSGVGKTETALALADVLFGGERFIVTINMSEFQERHTVSRLIGSPPGYVGYGEGGKLTEAVRQRPYSVVLLDEVEKADREVMNLFYQVFDKGVLNDGEGRLISFSNTVIVMTTNLATDILTKAADPRAPSPKHEDLIELVKPTLRDYFKPALLARMTPVPYIPIRAEALKEIVTAKLNILSARAKESQRVTLLFDDSVVDAIAERCREVESGARNVDHILRGTLLPLLSGEILKGLADGNPLSDLRVSVNASNDFVCGERTA